MKTSEQIKHWLQAQPWYDDFKEKVMDGNDISYNAKRDILNGKRGIYTIREAICYPAIENWRERDEDFTRWFCSNEDNNI